MMNRLMFTEVPKKAAELVKFAGTTLALYGALLMVEAAVNSESPKKGYALAILGGAAFIGALSAEEILPQ